MLVVSSAAGALIGSILSRFIPTKGPPKVEPPKPERIEAVDAHAYTEFYDNKLEVSAGAIDRAQAAATFIQGAAAAVAALYTGAIGLIFVADNPLPWRGFVSTAFLAGAVVLAAFYIGFLTKGRLVGPPEFREQSDTLERLLILSQKFGEWTANTVRTRQAFLRAAVVSLAVGVLLLPLPFIEVPASTDAPDPAAITFPKPQFEEPAELAMIVYQAQVDHFVDNDLKPAPESDEAENRIALGGVGVGVIAVFGTLFISWWIDSRPSSRAI